MSSWLSAENFLYSRTATWCRYGLAAFAVCGVGSDYYLTHYYRAFDPQDGQRYVIDWSPIGKPRCQMLLIPNSHYTNYSPWTPRNGDVVVARAVEDEPNYLQLLNGRFVERQTCGVPLMRPLDEVEAEAERGKKQKEALLSYLTAKSPTASA
ncbi:putative mitochondrial 18 kDa ER-associated protein (ERAP18) [Leptomonas pyrrhocoris]|uniref:Putative mitochondrial 18 kDa ER-associated protein (ERAP18) n=1 Tax=Leptomonas pyrrhocoris TaxID=157538 RepID=A0A0N0DZC2_LEPPY|nr:putative mitochondrial 18 kDa ER-associated protein (ERAP18) [Leptomonas pyrrhocoris]XP_015663461.1 putative mitochondrial 18 kDa ER-associated protein (ERAP18) [Leptomonas pyrrhocoris]KPA85021.1 putative mitochondrial 18 kDa ER-associated protein (ERAP18) [Leptomonas pyrrhocoris]KPA85022.1 putative mitochondrial 18 kDa ER-associated protein (ERAP18) [Leptomonas pyrrhocoris]|eukprot:XP_015663460.1 putative mitochondrial 18 kDa ER-associated protein (ERAP18) [Leptomonas pyrrhocoris]